MLSPKLFDYHLPPELIAQAPVEPRDASRLLVLNRQTGQLSDRIFRDVGQLLPSGSVLVRNNTKVLPARLFGQKETGGKCEVLLVHQLVSTDPARTTAWECLTKPGLRAGQVVTFGGETPAGPTTAAAPATTGHPAAPMAAAESRGQAEPAVTTRHSPSPTPLLTARCRPDSDFTSYTRIIEFDCPEAEFARRLLLFGHTPLPPYITRASSDEAKLRQIYQTTYAKLAGSVAAPTAGLHFTPQLDQALRRQGITILEVTLHVGLGTFLPVQEEQIRHKRLHREYFELSPAVAATLNQAKAAGRQITAVGTTTTRVLESCWRDGQLQARHGTTELFIQPGDRYHCVDALITNFHLPQSSLLMLLSAFVCQPNTQAPFQDFGQTVAGVAYQHAIAAGYRFFSFGDAMYIHD